nr:MBG domain-containing protein [Bowmanella yangjiangensis]
MAVAAALTVTCVQATDLPSGGQVVAGDGALHYQGDTLTIHQQSDKLIANWQQFSIGRDHSVNFIQPGSQAVALNRVIGHDPSHIYGQLTANGQVFLVNPNGILFGEGASVNVGALVASTLSLSDADFLGGQYRFGAEGERPAALINRGSLQADNGTVALLGGYVSNEGLIQANQGNVALAAGEQITLDFAGDGLLSVSVDEGTVDALVENHQLIRAHGGQVLMTAHASQALLQTVVSNTGVIEAHSLESHSGKIVLKGGFNGGTVKVAGTLDASAPVQGDGGFIDTSGAYVQIAEGTQVTTLAPNGSTGEWLIDPTDFYITPGGATQTASGIGADTLMSNLGSTNVTLQTVATGAEAGDIYVNAALNWTAATNLELRAHNNIHINQAISASNGGLRLDAQNQISAAGAINVGNFALLNGAFSQVAASLPGFEADVFYLNTSSASFLRALGGDGSQATPYLLTDIFGVQGMASQSLLGQHFALANAIDASSTVNWAGGAGFMPIGSWTTKFTGSLDGMGYAIDGLTINRGSTNYVGLFGAISGSAISNLHMTNSFVKGKVNVGSLVGQAVNNARITNSSVQGDVVVTSGYGGGLAGIFAGQISHSSMAGTLDSYNVTGGLVGTMTGQINHSFSTASVSGGYSDVGGLVGGITGNIVSSYATGDVMTSGANNVGGLAGSITGDISNSNASGNVRGASDTGGLVGESRGTITLSYATGHVEGGSRTGGLVGAAHSGLISQSYATGNVNNPGLDDGGGLVGYSNVNISQSFASGNVSGGNRAGGLAGSSAGNISQSYATGNVHGGNDVGGLVGSSLASITQSYASGQVSSFGTDLGGLVGQHASVITDSYWNSETSGQSVGVGNGSTAGTTGLTTEQMFNASNLAGFDFSGIWGNADNQSTPYLLGLAGNRVFNQNHLPSGTISATNRPVLYQVIQDVDQLQAIQQNLSGYYLLGNAIDASATAGWHSGAGFMPIGSSANRFTGSLDGMGYAIDGLTINRGSTNNVGLFSYNSNGSTIRNIGLTNVDIAGASLVGGIAGRTYGNIRTVYVTGKVTAGNMGGGIVGLLGGELVQSYANIDVTSSIGGGLVGIIEGDIHHSYASGTVSGGMSGGLVGQLNGGSISHSYTTVIVNGNQTNLIGFYDFGFVSNSFYASTDSAGNPLTSTGIDGTPKTWAELTQLSTFADWGANIDAEGGSGSIWRIYAGHSTPLLRNFLTPLTLTAGNTTVTYNGQYQTGAGGWTASGPYDANLVLGEVAGGGTNAGTYQLGLQGMYSTQQGYDLMTHNGTLTINKALATVTANSGSVTYNGQMQSIDGFSVSSLVGGEDASVLGTISSSGGSGLNAGTYTHSLSGGSSTNYDLTFIDGSLTINKAQATVTANSGSVTYNGQMQSIDGFSVSGLVGGEDASVLGTISSSGGSGLNAGTYTHSLSGGNSANYDLTFIDGSLTINKALATVTANSGSVTYNGQMQSIDGFTVSGLVAGEDASVLDISSSGGSGRNAGSYTHSLSGGADNYDLTFIDGLLTIEQASLLLSATSDTKIYDGNTDSQGVVQVSGLMQGDNISGLSQLFAGDSAGEQRLAVQDGYHIEDGNGGANYRLTLADAAGTIEQREIQGWVTADDKLYDGTLLANTAGGLDGVLAGDDVTLRVTGNFTDTKVGKDKVVLVNGQLVGADAANYRLVLPDQITASIDGIAVTANYLGALVSQMPKPRQLSLPPAEELALQVTSQPLRLAAEAATGYEQPLEAKAASPQ